MVNNLLHIYVPVLPNYMIIINRSSKDNATSQECKDTQKTPNALVVNRSDIGQSVFWISTYPFTLPLLYLCYVSTGAFCRLIQSPFLFMSHFCNMVLLEQYLGPDSLVVL